MITHLADYDEMINSLCEEATKGQLQEADFIVHTMIWNVHHSVQSALRFADESKRMEFAYTTGCKICDDVLERYRNNGRDSYLRATS